VTETHPGSDSETSQSAVESRRWRTALDQLGTIVLSIALGLVIWLIAVNQRNPVVTDGFPERIPITVRGLDAELQPVQDLSKETVRVVSLRAPRSAWEDLEASDFTATIDLTNAEVGSHDLPVTIEVNDPRVTILEQSPPSLRVQVDPLVSKVMTVTAQVGDSPAFGYDWLPPVVTPLTVTVKGAKTQVDLVSQVVAPILLLNAKNQVERTVGIQPLTRLDQPVTGIEMDANVANVIVPVEQWPGRKEVAVRINLVGQPAPGYRLSTVRAEPSTVVLQGAADILAQVPGFIETEPLSIEGATTEIRQSLNLVVPDGSLVFDGSTVQSIVNISPIEGGTTVTEQPIVQGLGERFAATFSPESVDVILSGPVPLLESLNPDDMFVILDLSSLLPGTHVVTPRVVLPEGIRQEGVLPETVEVVISELAPLITPLPEPAQTSGQSSDVTVTPTSPTVAATRVADSVDATTQPAIEATPAATAPSTPQP
jgi:YbbR domain-containing protein